MIVIIRAGRAAIPAYSSYSHFDVSHLTPGFVPAPVSSPSYHYPPPYPPLQWNPPPPTPPSSQPVSRLNSPANVRSNSMHSMGGYALTTAPIPSTPWNLL